LKYDGELAKDALVDWVKSNYHGLCGHKTTDNAKDFKLPLVTVYYDVDYVKNVKGTNYWRNRVMKVAKNFAKLNFAVANENDFQHEADEFGLDVITTDKPLVAIKSDKGKFVMKAEFAMDTFEQFLKDYEDGKVEPHLKSEDIPEPNDGPVKVAVAKNFEELVANTKKDVLIEFYAPWCGHCKAMIGDYAAAAKHLTEDTALKSASFVVAAVDATAERDVANKFDISGYPTLKYLRYGKNPQDYDGGRKKKDLVDFMVKKMRMHRNEL
jgi:protein disulfide isomerase family A protein 3